MRLRGAAGLGFASALWVRLSFAQVIAPPALQPPKTTEVSDDPAKTVNLEVQLSRNVSLYEAGHYEECASGLNLVVQQATQNHSWVPELTEQAQIYLGACLIASGNTEQAERVFAEAIRNNPQMRAPDSLLFPAQVVDRFLQVRKRLLSEIRDDERARIAQAEQRAQQLDQKKKAEQQKLQQLRALAAQETVIEQNRRWLAYVPFGVGQFQNRDYAAGWVFLGAEAALAITAVTALVVDERLANKVLESGIDRTELATKRRSAYNVIAASTWSLGVVAIAGIVHANWRFVPERRSVRPRPLPSELSSGARLQPPNIDVGLMGGADSMGMQLQIRF